MNKYEESLCDVVASLENINEREKKEKIKQQDIKNIAELLDKLRYVGEEKRTINDKLNKKLETFVYNEYKIKI